MQPLGKIAYRACALAAVFALSSTSVAWAAPVDTTSTPAPTSAVTPKKSTPKPKPAAKPKPAPSAIPVPVDPATLAFRSQLEAKNARLEELRAQLDALDRELSIAAEAYDDAAGQLADIRERLDMTQQDLGDAATALDVQQRLLDERVQAMYRDGELSAAEILLGARSIPDLLERIDFIRTISSSDADLAKRLSIQREQIANQEIDLKTAEIQASALEFALKARKLEIELRMADRQALLTNSQQDLLALLDTQTVQSSAQEQALWREIMAGASKAGVQVTPLSPVETILSYHGVPYLWGGASPTGFDCSGLTMYVFRQHGVELPHHAASQVLLGEPVSPADLRPGDLVFFGSPIHHVGMYIGGGYYVHAPKTNDYVKVSKLADRNDMVGARRYPWRARIGPPMGRPAVSLPSNLPTGK